METAHQPAPQGQQQEEIRRPEQLPDNAPGGQLGQNLEQEIQSEAQGRPQQRHGDPPAQLASEGAEKPAEQIRLLAPNAHEAIITTEQFERVQEIRATHVCPTNMKRFNLFRGKLFCECCGHQLMISRKQLLYREADIYFCAHHFSHPDQCPKTHRVYHEMLYPYVLQQIQAFAKSMKRRKINSAIKDYASITELAPEIIDDVIERIEIGHVTKKSRPGSVIQIYWKLK